MQPLKTFYKHRKNKSGRIYIFNCIHTYFWLLALQVIVSPSFCKKHVLLLYSEGKKKVNVMEEKEVFISRVINFCSSSCTSQIVY